MNKETISNFQGISLIILFIGGSTLALPTALSARQDLWLAIFFAMIISIPLYLIYSRLLAIFPGNDLFDILNILFGKFFGKIIGLIFIWYTFHLGTLVLSDESDFLITVSLPETPEYISILLISLLCAWVVKEGIEILGRWSTLFVLLNVPLPFILILLLIPEMDLNNILPMFYTDTYSFIKGTMEALSFPFGDSVVFLMVLFSLKSNKSFYTIFSKGLLIGGILIVIVSLAELLVLGSDLYSSTYFPNHNLAGKISIMEILERLEVLAITATITSMFLKISICTLAVCNGISKLLNLKDYRSIVIPIILIMCNFSFFIHDNIIEKYNWILKIGTYYFLPFQIIMPILIWIIAEIKRKNHRYENP